MRESFIIILIINEKDHLKNIETPVEIWISVLCHGWCLMDFSTGIQVV